MNDKNLYHGKRVDNGERYLLQLQLQKMCEYADILTARLGVWREI